MHNRLKSLDNLLFVHVGTLSEYTWLLLQNIMKGGTVLWQSVLIVVVSLMTMANVKIANLQNQEKAKGEILCHGEKQKNLMVVIMHIKKVTAIFTLGRLTIKVTSIVTIIYTFTMMV